MSTPYNQFENMEEERSVGVIRRNDESEKISPLMYMLAGYLFLMIFRPYEYWSALGEWRIERVYMIIFMGAFFLSKKRKLIPSPLNGAVVLMGVVLVLSGIFSWSWDASWIVIEGYLKLLVFYFMAIMSVRTAKDFRFLLLAFIGIMFLYVGKSAWEYFVHARYVWRMGMKRMMGVDVAYGAPNSFSASICFSLPILWALIRSKPKNVLMRYGLWAYGALALVAIIFTGSRSGMFTALLFFFLILVASSRRLGFAILLLIVFFLTWEFMPVVFQDRFLSTFMDDVGPVSAHESAEGRMHGFMQGMRLFASYPVFGIGPGNFPLSWPEGMNAHNLFGQVLGELGLCGIISFGLLLVLIVILNLRILRIIKEFSESKLLVNNDKVRDDDFLHFGSTLHVKRACNYSKLKRRDGALYFEVRDSINLYAYVSVGILQTLILMIFKGWGDHNLYRYTWLLLAALTVLVNHFFSKEMKRFDRL